MKFVLLVYQGSTPLPGSDRWNALPEAKQKAIYADYAELKSRYTGDAVRAMRREVARVPDGAAVGIPVGIPVVTDAPATDDEIEAAVLAYRRQSHSCAACGPRPEADAVYCSNCGRFLHDRCAGCGAPVVALDARYCLNCGNRLAA